jgi:uncharacterized protein
LAKVFQEKQRELADWRGIFDARARELYPSADPSHDILHIRRVVATALKLAEQEGAAAEIVLPAAYFHDFVTIPKNDARRAQASTLSGAAAAEYLSGIGYPARYIDAVRHAIAAHSFSAGIAPETLEAKIVQDADRLDSLGAIGVARCFTTSALLGRPYYEEADPFSERRAPDDKIYTVDHFYVKLLKLAEGLHTRSAREEGKRRLAFMQAWLAQLRAELKGEHD